MARPREEREMPGNIEQQEEAHQKRAFDLFEKRTSGEINMIEGKKVDDFLKSKGIEPGTPAAEKFMREWDWKEAKKESERPPEKETEDLQTQLRKAQEEIRRQSQLLEEYRKETMCLQQALKGENIGLLEQLKNRDEEIKDLKQRTEKAEQEAQKVKEQAEKNANQALQERGRAEKAEQENQVLKQQIKEKEEARQVAEDAKRKVEKESEELKRNLAEARQGGIKAAKENRSLRQELEGEKQARQEAERAKTEAEQKIREAENRTQTLIQENQELQGQLQQERSFRIAADEKIKQTAETASKYQQEANRTRRENQRLKEQLAEEKGNRNATEVAERTAETGEIPVAELAPDQMATQAAQQVQEFQRQGQEVIEQARAVEVPVTPTEQQRIQNIGQRAGEVSGIFQRICEGVKERITSIFRSKEEKGNLDAWQKFVQEQHPNLNRLRQIANNKEQGEFQPFALKEMLKHQQELRLEDLGLIFQNGSGDDCKKASVIAFDLLPQLRDTEQRSRMQNLIIEHGSSEFRRKTGERIVLAPDSSKKDFLAVIEHCSLKLQDQAWERLKPQAQPIDLRAIIFWGPERMKGRAWEEYKKKDLSIDDLRTVVIHGKGKFRQLAWSELLKKNPSAEDIGPIAKISWVDKNFKEEIERVMAGLKRREGLRGAT